MSMSSFTKHTSIYSSENIGQRINADDFRYYIGGEGGDEYVDVPSGYEFDGASVPKILGILIQKVETDTIASACLHDYLYTDDRKYGRIKSDLIFFESLLVYNIPKLIKQKRYSMGLLLIFKYILMTIGLILFSRIVWYKILK